MLLKALLERSGGRFALLPMQVLIRRDFDTKKLYDQYRGMNLEQYRGPFEPKRIAGGKHSITDYDFEELFERIQKMRHMKVDKPAPVHLVWRTDTLVGKPWHERVILRKLGLVGQPYMRVIVPNTPHFNKLLWEIKHLIRLKPVTFPDGIPSEADVGATKMCVYSGVMRKSEAFRVPESRLNEINSKIYEGNYLTEYLRKLCGIFKITW